MTTVEPSAGGETPQIGPHLLTLPREIRDNIYEYLHRTIRPGSLNISSTQTLHLVLKNAPYPAVLRVHSLLYQEYLEADCIRNLEAEITFRYDFLPSHFEDEQWAIAALPPVHHITISIWQPDSQLLDSLECYLKPRLPTLRSVRLALSESLGTFTDAQVTADMGPWNAQMSPCLPAVFLELPSVQVAEAHHVGYSGRIIPKHTDPLSTRIHHMRHLKTSLYTFDNPTKYLWTQHHVLTFWRSDHYPREVLSTLSKERQDTLATWPLTLHQWQDARFEQTS